MRLRHLNGSGHRTDNRRHGIAPNRRVARSLAFRMGKASVPPWPTKAAVDQAVKDAIDYRRTEAIRHGSNNAIPLLDEAAIKGSSRILVVKTGGRNG